MQSKAVFTKSLQKLPLTLVLGYLSHFKQIVALLQMLCKGSRLFLENNR